MDHIIKFVVQNEYNPPSSDDETYDIIYSVDKRFSLGAAISATSLLINSKKKFNFHIFTDFVDADYICKINELASKFKTNIYIYIIDNSSLTSFPTRDNWTIATYYRFVAFQYLSEFKKTALYLDADVICKSTPDSLFDIDITGKYAAIVPDIDLVQQKCEQRLNVSGLAGHYFNAGVIYVNLYEWKKNGLTEKSLAMLNNKNVSYAFLDQDILNLLFNKKTILLSEKYNTIYDAAHHFGLKDLHNYNKIIKDDTVFIHYTSSSKPWLQWMRYSSSLFFDLAYHQSPWAGSPLLDAHSAKLLKLRSKHEFRQKKYLNSIFTQIRYIIKKIKK